MRRPGPGLGFLRREVSYAALFFLGATILATWPQALHLADGLTDLWDAKLVTRILHWDYRQTLRDPRELFQLNIFHPAKYVLAFSENLWGAALFGFPLYAAGVSPMAVYNTLFLLGMFASALSAWALARYVTGDALASAVAGLVYAFVPWRLSQMSHIQFQWGPFLCLLLLFLLRYLDAGRRADLAFFGVFFLWNVLTNIHYGLFGFFTVAVTLALEGIEGGRERGQRVRNALIAAAVAALASLPFLVPYRRAAELYGMRRSLGETAAFSGRPTDFLSAGDRNRLYGALTKRWDAAEGFFFPGLLPLALAAAALGGLRRPPGADPPRSEPIAPLRHLAARMLDVSIALAAGAWIAALLRPHLRIGPLHLGDPGRIQVVATALVVARLAAAFPRGRRFRDLADFLRARRLDRRAVLLLGIGGVGVLIALGAHTPYYRFLFQSFGGVFRAIRVPARGIVLFHVALATLAAWGLSLLTRRRPPHIRFAAVAAAVVLIGFEYRAFPVTVYPVEAEPPAVHRWLKSVDDPGAVVEWPLGLAYDYEHVFRQTAHEKALVNGYSGFFPKTYANLQATLRRRPIPDSVWEEMIGLGATVLVYHPHAAEPLDRGPYRRAARRGLETGTITLLGSFPHGSARDFAFRLSGSPLWRAKLSTKATEEGRRDWQRFLAVPEADLSPPFGGIHLPAEGQAVAPGFWGFGWALDDSGLAEIQVATELGPAGLAQLEGKWPGLFDVYPDYKGLPGNGGYGFVVPPLPSGAHTLVVTFVARDGGTTVLRRSIVVP